MKSVMLSVVRSVGLIVVLIGLTAAAQAGEKAALKRGQVSFEGTVAAMDFKASTLEVSNKAGKMTFECTPETKIFVERVPGEAKLVNLKVGDKIEVYYVEAGGKLIAQRIAEKGSNADKKERREAKGK